MKLRFRRKSKAEWVALFVMFMPFVFFFLIELLRFPSLVKYTIDLGWIYLLGCMIKTQPALQNSKVKSLLTVTSLFAFFTLFGFLGNFQSPLYYLWGLRNNIRFFVFFFACILYLNPKSISNYLTFFDKLFWINFPVVLFQYYVLGYDQDNLGGIFGVEQGCNGYMNIFLLIIVAKSILWYLYKKEPVRMCLLKIAVALVIAVFAELKVFFVELVVVVLFLFFTTNFSLRKVLIALLTVVGLVVSVRILAILFPQFEDWFHLKNIWNTLTSEKGYTGKNDLNRLTAVSVIADRFLPTFWKKLFGLGLGNCDYAAYDFLITPFYRSYGKLNYMWFSSAIMFLETGAVGLILYIVFFLRLFFMTSKKQMIDLEGKLYTHLAQVMALMCLVLIVYNSSLRTEAAFMAYFVLALPFIYNRQNIIDRVNEESPLVQ